MAHRILTTHEATVQTVQVEIQVLKVGKKQVTMGLFRQLPREVLLDPDTLQLRGVPWGHVQYWWEGEGLRAGPKLHVVWQRGQELRRAIVYQIPDPAHIEAYQTQIQRHLDDWVVLVVDTGAPVTIPPVPPGVPFGGRHFNPVTIGGKRYSVTLSPPMLDILRRHAACQQCPPEARAAEILQHSKQRDTAAVYANHVADYTTMYRNEALQASKDYHALLEKRALTDTKADALVDTITALQHEQADYNARWGAQWQVLHALPQLFIAV